jgi:hypothetical protein
MEIPLTKEEIIHIADLLRSDIIARNVFMGDGDESTKVSKRLLVRITVASLKLYDDEPEVEPTFFSPNPRLN